MCSVSFYVVVCVAVFITGISRLIFVMLLAFCNIDEFVMMNCFMLQLSHICINLMYVFPSFICIE